MGKDSVVGTEVPKVMRHVARYTKGKHLGMHVQSKLQHLMPTVHDCVPQTERGILSPLLKSYNAILDSQP